jgi:hypothetical protein
VSPDQHNQQRDRVAASVIGLHMVRDTYANRHSDPAWKHIDASSLEDEAWDELRARRDRLDEQQGLLIHPAGRLSDWIHDNRPRAA